MLPTQNHPSIQDCSYVSIFAKDVQNLLLDDSPGSPYKTDDFLQLIPCIWYVNVYKNHVFKLFKSSSNSIQTEVYSDILEQKKKVIDALLHIGMKSEENINTLKLDIRINSNKFNKVIENEKNGNTGNVWQIRRYYL